MNKKTKGINEIDLHGVRHKEAIEMVKNFLDEKKMEGSFSIIIITGNSTVLQKRIFKEILELSSYKYYVPSWNLGQIIVDWVEL